MMNAQSPDLQKIFSEILSAEKKIRRYIRETPLDQSSYLSSLGNANIFLKLENQQHNGSFKVRGAFNKILSLSSEQRQRGIITASTGNHGMATGYALQKLHSSGTVYLPENVSKAKLSKLQEFDVQLLFYGQDSGETEKYARKIAKQNNQEYISPYNDVDIIAGQGTIGVELIRQLKEIDYVLVTIGGGGLISGIATYLKSINANTKVIGCLPEHSPVFYESIKAGRILEMDSKPTLSDGSAGGIEDNAITFDLIANNNLVDEYILVSEKEIRMGIQTIFREHRLVIEGAAAVAVSAFIKEKDKFTGNVVILICGGNIDMDIFLSIVCPWKVVDVDIYSSQKSPLLIAMSSNITYDDFTKLSLRVGTITSVEEIPKADKIYKLTVNLGEELGIRTLVAGIKQQYEIADLIQRQIVVLVNLEPRTIRKVTSHGMLLAGDVDGAAILLQPDTNVPNGTHIR